MRTKAFTIICGHYGCGKTNLSINLAIEACAMGCKTTLVDMDLVNPYFRSSNYASMLSDKGIRVITPAYAKVGADLPMLSREIDAIIDDAGKVIVDVGGDGAGAVALGRYADRIKAIDYDMLYVINRYRARSTKPDEAVKLLRDIERSSRLSATAIVNNSHLMQESTPETIQDALPYAQAVSNTVGLPLRCTVAPRFVLHEKGDRQRLPIGKDLYLVDVYVRPPW